MTSHSLSYPRIDTFRKRDYSGRKAMRQFAKTGIMYAETYEVRLSLPDRPIEKRNGMTLSQAQTYIHDIIMRLRKNDTYEQVMYNGKMLKL